MCILEMFYLKRGKWIVDLGEKRQMIIPVYEKGKHTDCFQCSLPEDIVLLIIRKRPQRLEYCTHSQI